MLKYLSIFLYLALWLFKSTESEKLKLKLINVSWIIKKRMQKLIEKGKWKLKSARKANVKFYLFIK